MTQPLTLTHGGALSNLPLFLALDAELFAPLGLDVFAAPLDGFGSTAGRLRDGSAAIGTTGFTQVLADATSPDPLVAVAGSGLRGMAVLGRRGATLKSLVGATVGTFADDPMQVLLADVLAHYGLDGRVHVRMMRSLQAAADGLEQGEFQSVTTIEPWISFLRGRGATLLSDGTDVWGPDYPDTILVARRSVVDTAPDQIEAAIKLTTPKYFKTTFDAALDASTKQPGMIDQRRNQEFILGRAQNLKDLRYIKTLPTADIFDWTMLNEVIAENADLYGSLKLKSA